MHDTSGPHVLTEGTIRDLLGQGTLSGLDEPNTSSPGLRGSFRKAAVLMPLVQLDGSWHLLLTRRTELVADHKGQVAFPGGSWEPGDASLQVTALREAEEEIGLRREDVRILGKLDQMLTVTSFLVEPYVGVVTRWPYAFQLSVNEVGRVFTIPLTWLSDSRHWEERPYFNPQRSVTVMSIYYKNYDGEMLWGASARMTLTLLKVLRLVD